MLWYVLEVIGNRFKVGTGVGTVIHQCHILSKGLGHLQGFLDPTLRGLAEIQGDKRRLHHRQNHSAHSPASSCDVAVAACAQAIAIALTQKHGITGVVAAKQMSEPGDAEMQREVFFNSNVASE